MTDKYTALMLLIFPLWTGLGGYADITRWKFVFFAAATAIWAVLLIFFALREPQAPNWPRGFAILAAALAVWACVSALASPFGTDTLMGHNYDGLIPLLLYIAIALGCAGYGQWRDNYVNYIAISVTLCCLVAVLQLCGLNPLWLYPEGVDYYDAGVLYTGSFLGTMGNTNLLGAFLCLTAPVLAYTAVQKRGKSLWLLVPAVLAVVIIVISRSEAGLVGIAAALLAGIPYYVNKNGHRRTALFILALEAALVLLALAAVYFFPPASGTLYELHEMLHGRIRGEFGSSRVAIWSEALRLVAERPLTGGGPGTFGLRSTLEFTRFVPETGATLTTVADNAHCELLSALVDLGVPGALLYLAILGYVVWRWFKGSAPAAGLALISYWAQAFFGIGTCFVLPFAAILSGLVSVQPFVEETKKRGRVQRQR